MVADVSDADPTDFTRDLVRWSETLAAIARTGLGFTQNLYERERFEEILHVAADIKAAADEALEVVRELQEQGVKVGVTTGFTRAMLDGRIESTSYLRNPLDVLAQQIVAHASMSGDLPVEKLAVMIRRTSAFAELGDDMLHNVLDLLSGRYPSEEFSELRPRIVWDRIADVIRARDGAKRLAVTNGGTISGHYGIYSSLDSKDLITCTLWTGSCLNIGLSEPPLPK